MRGIFAAFMRLMGKKPVNLWEIDFDEIWKLEPRDDLLAALYGWLCRKSAYGAFAKRLSHAEMTLFLVWQMEAEVINGGFSQFFSNSSGNFANDTAAALREIGANRTAELCERALAPFGGRLPPNRDEREVLLDSVLTEEIDEILARCDSEFFQSPDDLVALNHRYVMENRTRFTRS